VVSGELWDAQTPASRPPGGAQGLRCVLQLDVSPTSNNLGAPRFVTVIPSRCVMRTSPQQTAHCPTTGWCQVSCVMLKQPPPSRVAAHRGSGVFSNWTCRPQLGVPRFATVIPSRCGMRTSPRQTAPCPTTGWCQVSCGMLKHPPPGRVAAHRGSGVFSNWTCRQKSHNLWEGVDLQRLLRHDAG
jgi:hypothetical protein